MRPRLGAAPELARDAGATLARRPVRTAGMVLGVVVGVAVGVATSTLGTSQQTDVLTTFDRQLSGFVAIEAQPPPGVSNTEPLLPLDPSLEDVILEAPGASRGGELSIWREATDVQRNRASDPGRAPLVGFSPGGAAAAGLHVAAGAPLSRAVAAVGGVWLGQDLAATLGVSGPDLGAVLVDGRPLPVAGLVEASTEFPSLDVAVLIGSPQAAAVWGPPERGRVVASIRRGSAERATAYLLAALDPTRTNGLIDTTPPDNRIVREQVDRDLRRAGLVLSGLALVVGAVAVANTLSMSVVQRRSELGLRAALGWTRARIATLVLAEATIAGILATVVGLAVGLGTSWAITRANGWELVLPSEAIWWPLTTGLLAAIVGGVSPAIRAGGSAPLDALRG